MVTLGLPVCALDTTDPVFVKHFRVTCITKSSHDLTKCIH